MKKFLFIVGIIVLAGAVFIGGIVAGTGLDLMSGFLQISSLQRDINEMCINFMDLSRLDAGEIDDVKQSMNSRLDSQILSVGIGLKDHPNPESINHAQAWLARIAEYRIKNPVPKDEDAEMAEVDALIQEFLDHALEYTKQQNQSTHSITASGGSE